ncbi:receptor-type guanylate cyclase Gyc76C isoform X2 [Maniola hyperantus]|uniref:receptor-type guanylate cyclase Gyc76C isoform X2 n=1 Tax=Aphantopus hyperantus TaxID=2795564 RepID=UPI0037483BE8
MDVFVSAYFESFRKTFPLRSTHRGTETGAAERSSNAVSKSATKQSLRENATRSSHPIPQRNGTEANSSSAERSDAPAGELDDDAPNDRLLILSDELEIDSDARSVYEEILQAALLHEEARRTGVEIFRYNFFLYKSTVIEGRATWTRAARVAVTARQPLGAPERWAARVAVDATGELQLRRRGEARAAPDADQVRVADGGPAPPTTALALCAACALGGALAAGAAAAVCSRRNALRRAPRRPRASPVLAAADFAFPADERRVGEGMESMLGWLQQLHELREAPRPDLLRRPEPPPSAPSSTCSASRLAPDARTRYKGDPVHMKYLPAATLELRRKTVDILLVMQSLRHENLNPFIGKLNGVIVQGDPVHMKYLPAATLELRRKTVDILLVMQSLRHENLNPFIGCLTEVRPALVWEACGRGSLEDVLVADDIGLDWTFRLSLLTDLVRGMRYLHQSPVRLHARLTSRNCVVDARWVLRVTDYGLPALAAAQALPYPPRTARELLWTAPELLREASSAAVPGGTQAGDVFSFGIVMQEVIVRGEPYCMLSLSPEEIVEKLRRPPPLVRPSVSLGAAPPDAVAVMRQCWSEQPDLRPDFARLLDLFRHMHRGRKTNIVDSMFEMLEKYSNNLEELIKDRTEQLDMEKKKTEQLLNRMLPRSVAERLLLGLRVEPETFEDVSVYFSDIVGFTALAARSTPEQVVDLLNDLYTTFDAAIEQYHVYKVETIGDAYMVVGGLPQRCADHAERVATMALHLLHLAGRFRIRHLPGAPLHLRSGLHSGACCAGVVGLTMPRYCLFGDTVNTAARMESSGAAWRVQLSGATAARLAAAGGFRLRARGLTQVKGKGAMLTYWLLGKDGFDKPLPAPPPLETEEVLFEAEGETEGDAPPARAARPAAAPPVERQGSDPCPAADKFAWQCPGAASAASSPPAALRRARYLRASAASVADAPDRWVPTAAPAAPASAALSRTDVRRVVSAAGPAAERAACGASGRWSAAMRWRPRRPRTACRPPTRRSRRWSHWRCARRRCARRPRATARAVWCPRSTCRRGDVTGHTPPPPPPPPTIIFVAELCASSVDVSFHVRYRECRCDYLFT